MARTRSKKLNLDYTYGSEATQAPEENAGAETAPAETPDDDDLVVQSASGMTAKQVQADLLERVRLREERRLASAKYVGYGDFARQRDSGTDSGYCCYIGYLLIRIISPLVLVFHGVGMLAWLYLKPIQMRQMPALLLLIGFHTLIVHLGNKSLFSRNYYKLRNR